MPEASERRHQKESSSSEVDALDTPLCKGYMHITQGPPLHHPSTLTCLLRPLHHLRTHAHAQALLTLNGQLYVRVHDG